MRDLGLRGKTVIITGAAAGIGRATALKFAREGAVVEGWDINEPGALPAEIESIGGEASFSKVDVKRRESVEEAVRGVMARRGSIDVLVNNAGIVRDAQIVKWKDGAVAAEMTDEQFDDVINVNLRGVFLCARAVIPHMIAGGGGVILNASSVVGLYGNFGQTNYTATKAGVIAMTKTWSRELGRYNIRVNAVAPGFVATEILNSVPEKIIAAMIDHTPLKRMGKPDDIAEAYLWLASDCATFITGAVLSVDGGLVVGT
jgi:3-oxoacyl-[acyl-carrier protein] reductase